METRQVIAIMAAIIFSAGLQAEPVEYTEAVEVAEMMFRAAQKIPFTDI